MHPFLLAFALLMFPSLTSDQHSSAPPSVFTQSEGSRLFLAGATDAPRDDLRKSLMDRLMDKFHAMNDTGQGFFQDDITPTVAPYFPPGQPIAETKKILSEQNLGELQKFKGMQDPNGGTMYVTKFNLMNGLFSEVYVVLNFDFDGQTDADMTLKKTTAYIRGGNM